jgi:hypothetical protein
MKAGKISYPGVGVAVGGVLGILGVFMTWFSFAYVAGGQGIVLHLNGTHDWTGDVALLAAFGAFGFGGAYILMDDPQIRRVTGILMGVCSAFLLFMPLFAFTRLDDVANVPGASSDFGAGMAISFVGGIVAVVGTFLASREKDAVEASPAEAAEAEPEGATTA